MARRRRNKINVMIHYVWCTHERLPLLTAEVERAVYRYIEQVCHDDRCDVLAIGGMPDHIHLLVNMSPTVSLSDLMKHVKGGSSRLITTKLKPGEWFAWRAHYGAFAVAIRDKRKAIDYILCQKQHHADNTLLPELEQTDEEDDTDDTEEL